MGGEGERERERESCPRIQPKHVKIRKKTKCEGAIHA
jgi:hypothetical protein